MDKRDEDLFRAAQMYYVQNETMEAIASSLKVSRSTVSRLLKTARETGLVRISINPEASLASHLTPQFSEMFGVRAHVVSVRRSQAEHVWLDAVARVAARRLEEWAEPGSTIGVAWGTTLSAVVSHLQARPLDGVRVVQLNGAANHATSGIPYAGVILARAAEAFGASTTYFPVPAFFDYAATREAMWRERSVRRVLEMQESCDLAIFGVGSVKGGAMSHVYRAGYLDEDRRALMEQGVVGDVCTVLLREDGTYRDIELNARATGPNPEQLKKIPRRVCIVSGVAKVAPTLGALRAGVATDLVIDEVTARHVVDVARGRSTTAELNSV